jgi:transcriptional regulator with XRE-family HTH domain
MDQLATALTALRKRAGITRERMAAELGLSPAEITGIENASRVFTGSKPISDWASITGADDQERYLLGLWLERLDQAEAVTA